jgi:hypothetical protein
LFAVVRTPLRFTTLVRITTCEPCFSARMTNIENIMSNSRSDIESFSGSLQGKLGELSANVNTNADITSKQIDILEARILAMQLQLISSIEASGNPKRPKPSTKRRRKAYRVSANARKIELTGTVMAEWCSIPVSTAEYSVRLVKPALLLHEKGGLLRYEVTTLEDEDFEKLDLVQKTTVIQYLQGLRLLLWLLQRDNLLTAAQREAVAESHSSLASQASITSFWEFCNSFAELDNALNSQSLKGPSLLPWLRCKQWLQYLFDRIPDKDQEGERVMELVLRQWAAFPRPDGGEADSYILPVPRRLLTDSPAECSCPLHVNGDGGSLKGLEACDRGTRPDASRKSPRAIGLKKSAGSRSLQTFMYSCVSCARPYDETFFVPSSLPGNPMCLHYGCGRR